MSNGMGCAVPTVVTRTMVIVCDSLVIGGGAGGLMVALKMAEAGQKVAIVSKQQLRDSSSYLLKGGIAAVPLEGGKPLEGDSFNRHIRDTLRTGHGLCRPEVCP